jgi:hypothetical protein
MPLEATIDAFAAIVAQLDDAFANRAAILGAAGLDEASWKRLEDRCTTEILGRSDGALARRFSEAYAARRRPVERAAVGAPCFTAEGSRFLSREPQPWRDEAAAVSLGALGEAPRLLSVVESDTRPLARAATAANDLDATAEIAFGPPRAALPFLQTPPPGRRLHRFDTQTGLPLERPIWIDDPVAANDPTKPV